MGAGGARSSESKADVEAETGAETETETGAETEAEAESRGLWGKRAGRSDG